MSSPEVLFLFFFYSFLRSVLFVYFFHSCLWRRCFEFTLGIFSPFFQVRLFCLYELLIKLHNGSHINVGHSLCIQMIFCRRMPAPVWNLQKDVLESFCNIFKINFYTPNNKPEQQKLSMTLVVKTKETSSLTWQSCIYAKIFVIIKEANLLKIC